MEMKKNRKPNTTDKQKKLLVDFMILHPELVAGKNTSKSTVKQRQKLWESLAEELKYAEVGPNKSWSEWRKVCIIISVLHSCRMISNSFIFFYFYSDMV